MDWLQAIKGFSIYLKLERGLSDNSVEAYVRDVEKLLKYLEVFNQNYSPIDVDREYILQFIYDISQTVSAKTQGRITSGLRSFFDYLISENLRIDNPTDLIEIPKTIRKLPDTLSIEEIDKIVSMIDLSHPQGERNRAIIETLYGCGLRVSELTNLRLSDLYFDEGVIRVLGKGNKQRFIPIHELNQEYITRYVGKIRINQTIQQSSSDILFLNRRGNKLTRNMVFIIVKDLIKQSGIDKNISPHTFRHSFATHLLENGADLRSIQQMLGHESITTTEIYMHINTKYLKESIIKYHPRGKFQ